MDAFKSFLNYNLIENSTRQKRVLYRNCSIDLQDNSFDWFLYDTNFYWKVFLKRLQKVIKEADVFKISWQLYFITNAVQVCFLTEVDLRLYHKFWRKNTEWHFFKKDKRPWLLIIFCSKFLIVLSPLFPVIITPGVLKSSKI